MRISFYPLFLSLFPLFALIAAPLINPAYAIYVGTYFHNNVWNPNTTLMGEFILIMAFAAVYTEILLIKFNAAYAYALVSNGAALSLLGIYGVYSPFVLTASIAGFADIFLIISACLISFQWGMYIEQR